MFLKARYRSRETRAQRQHLQSQDTINSPTHPKNKAGTISKATKSIAREVPEL